MRYNAVVSILLFFFITGCSTALVPLSEAVAVPFARIQAFQTQTDVTSATIIIIRDKGFVGSACRLSFYLDGVLAAQIGPRQTARFYVEPGDHLVRAEGGGGGAPGCGLNKNTGATRETTLKRGETKVFRISTDASGSIDVQRAA